MSETTSDLKPRASLNTGYWGKGKMIRLAKKAGIDFRLISSLTEPINMPSKASIKKDIHQVDEMIERLETELNMRETTKKIVSNKLYAGCNAITSESEETSEKPSDLTDKEQINRIWEENRRRHLESERKLLYPTCDSITHYINIDKVMHHNTVEFNRNRYKFKPVIAEETRERYKHYNQISRQYKRLMDEWKRTHCDEDDDDKKAGRSWKDDMDKREKRSYPSRSIMRITRSQTHNMVECESVTSRDPEYFSTRQADVSNRQKDPCKYVYINHNAMLTTDGKPMQCLDLPRSKPCPPGCNCCYQVNEESKRVRPWSDMEKLIFINGFFNRPKDFRYIASTLTNRSVQDVIDFYYLHKRGMYIKLLLRVQLSMWKNLNFDSRPLILVAAYGIGLPIPEKMLGPDYASYDIGDYIKDDHYSILNSNQGLKPDDEMLLNCPDYHYCIEDNKHCTPAILLQRRNAREKYVEHLLMRMGIDLKHCIPTEDKMELKLEHHQNMIKEEEKKRLFKQYVESDSEDLALKKQKLDSPGKRKMRKVEDEDYS